MEDDAPEVTDSDELPTRTQKRALRTRRRLLNAALELFSENGVDATTIGEITERADLGKGTFYRHFSGRDDVMATLVEAAVDRLVERIRATGSRNRSLQDVLASLVRAHYEFFEENRDEFILLFQGRLLVKLQRDSEGAIEQPFMRYLGLIEAMLAPFVARPMDRADIRRLAYSAAGLVSGFFSFALIGMADSEIEESLQPLQKTFVSGCMAFLAGKGNWSPSTGETEPNRTGL